MKTLLVAFTIATLCTSVAAEAQVSRVFKEVTKRAAKNKKPTPTARFSTVARTNSTANFTKMRVNASALNVRSCPSDTCGKSRILGRDEIVTVYEFRGAWARISEAEEWVFRQYLSKAEYRMYRQAKIICEGIELTSDQSCEEED